MLDPYVLVRGVGEWEGVHVLMHMCVPVSTLHMLYSLGVRSSNMARTVQTIRSGAKRPLLAWCIKEANVM